MMLDGTITAAALDAPSKDGCEEEQFTALVDQHGSAILALLRRLCRNSPDADDAFQETAIRVWRGLAQCPPLTNARSWLLTIAFRAFVDLQARRQRNSTEQLADPTDNRIPSPTHAIQQQEENQRLDAALALARAGSSLGTFALPGRGPDGRVARLWNDRRAQRGAGGAGGG